ncbi:transposase [Gemmata sp. JC717]|uniref:transposase n=1 Tax=Gemmata algarum TaxID=2975278 RepID=UPI0021BAC76C|nr:transposase [Gemmata algarum]MDY3554985.1 transposase [Gemmata algarum]
MSLFTLLKVTRTRYLLANKWVSPGAVRVDEESKHWYAYRQDGKKQIKIRLFADKAASLTAASCDDGTTAPQVLAKLSPQHRVRLDEVRGDGRYNNRTLDRYLARESVGYQVTVVERPAGAKRLVHLPYRWVIERTNAWTGKCRRNSKDYERTTAAAEAMIQVSVIHLMLQRLAPDKTRAQATFKYTRKPMQKAAKLSG